MTGITNNKNQIPTSPFYETPSFPPTTYEENDSNQAYFKYTPHNSTSSDTKSPTAETDTSLPSSSVPPCDQPPSKSTMSQQSSGETLSHKAMKEREREEKISLALTRVNEGLSYRQAAKEIGISFGTVYGRFRGRKSRIRAQEVRMKLSFLEETIIERVLLSLICIGKPATQPFFVQTVNIILQAQGDTGVERVTRQWYRHFRRRHPSIDTRDFSILHNPPSEALLNELSVAWFNHFERVCGNFNVSAKNIYSMDELGFFYPDSHPTSIQPRNYAYKQEVFDPSTVDSSSPNRGFDTSSQSSRNGSNTSYSSNTSNTSVSSGSESINSLLENVPTPSQSYDCENNKSDIPLTNNFLSIEVTCGEGNALPPYLVLKSDLAKRVQAKYPQDWQIKISESGWLDENILLHWMKTHFDPLTSSKANGDTRVLILDTHVGHFSLPLLQYGIDNNIVFLFTPPHSQGLHPLDVPPVSRIRQDIKGSVFDFQDAINHYAHIREQALNISNVKSSWSRAGLIPFNPSAIKSLSPEPTDSKVKINDSLASPTSNYNYSPSSQYTFQSHSHPQSTTSGKLILHYIPIRDFDYNTFPLSTSAKQVFRTSPRPSFHKDSKPPNLEGATKFPSFDLNSYAPNTTRIFDNAFFSAATSTNANSELKSEGTSDSIPNLSSAISTSIETFMKNKALGNDTLVYYDFMSSFLSRLKTSLERLSSCLTNHGTQNKDALGHLALLLNELQVVDSYGKEMTSQVSNALKANDLVSQILQNYSVKPLSSAPNEVSNKRNIESVERANIDNEFQYQRRKDDNPQYSLSEYQMNNNSNFPDTPNMTEMHTRSHQTSGLPPVSTKWPTAPDTIPAQTTGQIFQQLPPEQNYKSRPPTVDSTIINESQSQSSTSRQLPGVGILPMPFKQSLNNTGALPSPFQFNSVVPARTTGRPMSLAQYSQSPDTNRNRRQSNII